MKVDAARRSDRRSSDPQTSAPTADRIDWVKVSLVFLPLAAPISDAKVLTGRQRPLTEIAFVFVEINTQRRL